MIRLFLKTLLALLTVWFAVVLLYLLPFVHPPSTLMLAGWVQGDTVERKWVPITDISRPLINTVLTAEDSGYCDHSGVDWESLEKATQDAIDGKRMRGASTIAMQTAKNLFLWPRKHFLRKVVELPMALTINTIWGKTRLLEIYLNMAELGDGIYGVEAAAQHYFGTSAKNLGYGQASRLAAILPNPKRNPNRLTPSIANYAGSLSRRASGNGAISDCITPH